MVDIRQSLIIASSKIEIYKALTTHEGLANWWTPDVAGSIAPGENLIFGFGPDYKKVMEIEKLDPEKEVQWLCKEAVSDWVDTTLNFSLADAPNGTKLKFAHTGWENYNDMFYQCSYDWAMFLRSMKKYCETGKGQPFPDQHDF